MKYNIKTLFAIITAGAVFSLSPCFAAVVYVKTTGSDSYDGASWQLAKRTIQQGINAASAGDEVWVGSGLFVERIKLKAGVKLYGGFPASGGVWASRDASVNPTTLNGNQLGPVVSAAYGANRDTVIDGFIIQNGKADTGGGIYCFNASPTITNNVIKQNNAYGLNAIGGGICCESSSPAIIGNVIEQNSASAGSGIYLSNHSCPIITRNIFRSNTGSYAIHCADYSEPEIRENIINSNAGGVYCNWYASAAIANNTVAENINPTYGDGMCFISSSPIVANNIFCFNSVGLRGNFNTSTSTLISHNCVYGNNSSYQGLTAGAGDISKDPGFVNRAASDYHISASSPCINAGSNSAVSLSSIDMDGQTRVWAGVVDIGAYEYQAPASSLINAKELADGTWIAVDGVVVTAGFFDFFYIQSSNYSNGIRVNLANHGMVEGKEVVVTGEVRTNAAGERYINAGSVVVK